MRMVPSGAPVLTARAMRAAEIASGVPVPELMSRAGAMVAREVVRLAAGRAVLVVAGPGKNGGDAGIAAELATAAGLEVRTVAHDMLGHAAPAAVLVDGVFGTGLSRPLDRELSAQLARLASGAELVIAVDLPSGLDTDTGASLGAVRADVTIALGALKPAHLLGDGVARCGHLVLAELGLPVGSSVSTTVRPTLARPAVDAHKFSRGMVAVAGGAMPGAARLAARAAMHGGAGYVVLAGEARGGPDALVHRAFDDELLEDARVRALLVGPGLGRDDAARTTLDRALACDRPLVLDGDALSLLGRDAAGRLRVRTESTILTPHAAEFERMFGGGEGNKIQRTMAAAQDCGCVVVHKGADTVIARPDGSATVAANAPAWLASAGTGDVLAGIVASRLAASGEDPAAEAVWLHGRAAELAGPAFIADGLIDALPPAFAECL